METEDFLAHYGIKGMKWGKRKARGSSTDKKPAKKLDEYQLQKRKQMKTIAVLGGTYLAARAITHGPLLVNTIKLLAMREAQAAAGARFAANLLADSRGIAAYSTIRI